MSSSKPKYELLSLINVGKAVYADLEITRSQQAPCVWDVFAAIIHEAKTGQKNPWWDWTKVRKKRQAAGTFLKSAK